MPPHKVPLAWHFHFSFVIIAWDFLSWLHRDEGYHLEMGVQWVRSWKRYRVLYRCNGVSSFLPQGTKLGSSAEVRIKPGIYIIICFWTCSKAKYALVQEIPVAFSRKRTLPTTTPCSLCECFSSVRKLFSLFRCKHGKGRHTHTHMLTTRQGTAIKRNRKAGRQRPHWWLEDTPKVSP